ncbi:Septin-domain-containing protein [Chytriomyces sp. MP71]|nr:Septin-domain-containing protein [Chytriomyces sp. MP71]
MPLEHALQHSRRFPDPGPWKLPKSVSVKLSQPLNIGELPAQKVRRSKRRPYVFNLMVVGDSGLGKTTFINTLFNAPLTENRSAKHLSSSKTVGITPTTFELFEENVTLHLTVVDTPGFGDGLNRDADFLPISDYIDTQYEKYLKAERSDEKRGNILDTRIHALLYFMPPGCNGLRDIDVEFLSRFCTKANIVPLIGKADGLSPEELQFTRKAILKDLNRYDIRIYPTHHADDRDHLSKFEKYIPFGVVASDDYIEKGGKKVRARKYRWGVVEVENEAHCDFVHLREMLIRTNMQDLIDTTHSVHYSLYRSGKMGGDSGNGRPPSVLACDDDIYDSQIQSAKKTAFEEMKAREEQMRQNFIARVRDKEAELRSREEALNAKRKQMMEEIDSIRRMLEG